MNDGGRPDQTKLHDIVQSIRQAHGDRIAVLLIGSAARESWSEESDIDLLVLGHDPPRIAERVSPYHIKTVGEAGFLHNLDAGEDFEAWCVRFGIILYDGGIWAEIKESPLAAKWPKWQKKVAHGTRRLLMADMLLETGDKNAAIEETLFALGHIARGILLKAQIFPLSRPELARQVERVGYPQLAVMHERLREPDGDILIRIVQLAQHYAKKLLCHLDAKTYRACALDYVQRRKVKQARRDS